MKPSLITGMQSTPMPPNVAVQPIHFCDIKTKDALSAIDRAKTESCKNMIRNITCTAEAGKLYDVTFKNLCPIGRNPARRFQAVPYEQGTGRLARVVFLMSIHGRAFRQVQRLFKALYHKDHYFFIHIDSVSNTSYSLFHLLFYTSIVSHNTYKPLILTLCKFTVWFSLQIHCLIRSFTHQFSLSDIVVVQHFVIKLSF